MNPGTQVFRLAQDSRFKIQNSRSKIQDSRSKKKFLNPGARIRRISGFNNKDLKYINKSLFADFDFLVHISKIFIYILFNFYGYILIIKLLKLFAKLY